MQQSDTLKNCNGMGRVGESWLPYDKRGDLYYDSIGRRLKPPEEWKPMHWAEIAQKMAEHGDCLVIWHPNVPDYLQPGYTHADYNR